MKIEMKPAGSTIKLSKSTRDNEMPGLKFGDCGLSKTPFSMYIVGRPGSGKSHFLESLIKHNYNVKGKQTCWDRIFYMCPETSQDSYENSFVNDMDEKDVYDTLTYDTLSEVYDEAKEVSAEGTAKKPRFSLVCIDDMAVELKDKAVARLLLKMLRNYRHIGLSIIICSQNYMALHSQHRQVIRQLCQFDTGSVLERERLWVEFASHIPKKEFLTTFWDDFMFSEKYQIMMIDRVKDFDIHKSFKRITISKYEDE
jgi:GTPase SAR1 family protein